MVRVLNFLCVAITGIVCLALYRVSEQTRMAHVELASVQHQIAQEHMTAAVLQAEWSRVANPARIQQLAQERLGLIDAPTIELSSLELLPRRGESVTPGDSPVRNANMQARPRDPRIRPASVRMDY